MISRRESLLTRGIGHTKFKKVNWLYGKTIEIPEEWELKKLDQISDVIDPYPSHRAPEEKQTGIPYLGIGDFDENGNILKISRYVDKKIFEEQRKFFKLGSNDIGIGRVATIGKIVKNVVFLSLSQREQECMDFFQSLLAAKTVQSVRLVGNIGFAILSDPTRGDRQNDVLTYGFSLARAFSQAAEIVGEINGRLSTRRGTPPPGTETRATMIFGLRYTRGAVRFDGGVFTGFTALDPRLGLTGGLTWVFESFLDP